MDFACCDAFARATKSCGRCSNKWSQPPSMRADNLMHTRLHSVYCGAATDSTQARSPSTVVNGNRVPKCSLCDLPGESYARIVHACSSTGVCARSRTICGYVVTARQRRYGLLSVAGYSVASCSDMKTTGEIGLKYSCSSVSHSTFSVRQLCYAAAL